ncbi:MAG: NTP transferase domain-containing protein [Planctomycetota bacterium]|nr:NTP transferase domain-containing protein [Planctomycetota bacterium]
MLQIVVPMAGEGQRFKDAGYALPKPLIPVSGVPMVARAVLDLPRASRVILLMRREHVERFDAERVLREHVPSVEVVIVDKLTEGQACTVALARDRLDPDGPVLVAACDNTHVYDADRHAALLADGSIDCVAWTFMGDPRVQHRPAAWGWVRVAGAIDDIVEVSCKVPISSNPLADHAITGFFAFRRASIMLDSIDAMVRANVRVNNEFYMDTVPNTIIARGGRCVAFRVEKYIGWGTPQDYEDYRLWERYFQHIARTRSAAGS